MAKLRDLFIEGLHISRCLLGSTVLAILIFFINSVLGFFNAMVMRDFIDAITNHYGLDKILLFGFILVVITISMYITSFYGDFLLQKLGIRGIYILANKILASLYRAKLRQIKVGDILARIVSDLPQLAFMLAGLVPAITIQLINFGITVFTLGYLSIHLLIVSILLIPLNYLIYKFTSKRISEYSRLERASLSNMVDELKLSLDNLFFIKRTCSLNYFAYKTNHSLNEWIKNFTRYVFYRIFYNKSYYYLNSIFRLIILIIGGILAIKGYFTIGTLIAFSSVLPHLYEPIMNIASLFTNLSSVIPHFERYKEIINLEKEDIAKGENLKHVDRIELLNVSIIMDSRKILDNVSLKVKRGETIGIVGPIGSGKTTLALTLIRIYEPDKGKILINNKDYKKYSLESIRKKIYYVPSKDVIINASLLENLTLGMQYPLADVQRVVSLIGIDFAELETIINPNKLSEGQKQKIALARALLRKPDVLILDEATNSLDANSEYELIYRIKEYLGDAIIIIISHRLTALRHAKKIYVMANGKIIDYGVHDELYKRCKIYKEIADRHKIP